MPWWHAALFVIGSAVPLFFLWAAAHELAHYLAVRAFASVDAQFYLWPHRHEGRWYWARVRWTYSGPERLSAQQLAWVFWAPRWADLLAVALLPLGPLMGDWGALAWTVVWAGGLIDLGFGSTGISETHDMRRYARMWELSPWLFRIAGSALIALSVALWALVLWASLRP